MVEEKEQVSQRLSEVQEKLHQETEGYFEKSAYAKSVAQQLQEEQHKVLKLRRAVQKQVAAQDAVVIATNGARRRRRRCCRLCLCFRLEGYPSPGSKGKGPDVA